MFVLGKVLGDADVWAYAYDSLCVRDFYFTEHQVVFECIKALKLKGSEVDLGSVSEQLNLEGKLRAIGGLSYLNVLLYYCPGDTSIQGYIDILKRKSLFRDVVSFLSKLESEGAAIIKRLQEDT